MGGITLASWVVLAAALLLSCVCVALVAYGVRTVHVLRADSRKREADGWRLDQEESFKALERRFAALSDDLTADLQRATRERENAQAANARAGRTQRRAQQQLDTGPRTREDVRRERLGDLRIAHPQAEESG